jgi:hypothetical protein
MSSKILTLLSNVSAESNDSTFSYGEKNTGAGYHNRRDGLHTAVYDLDNFAGTIKIQGTLELYPSESDWVDVLGTTVGGDSTTILGTTTSSINFTGNFVWLRAAYNVQNGTITEIRYNY